MASETGPLSNGAADDNGPGVAGNARPARQQAQPSSKLAPVQQGNTQYTQYQIDSSYVADEGLRMIPVAGPAGTPPKIVRLHGGTMMKRVQWTAERMGAKPVMPHWNPGNAGEVLAVRTVIPVSPILLNDVTQAWRASGVYEYFFTYCPTDQDRFPAGAQPPDTTPPEGNVLEVGLFDKTLLRTAAPASTRRGLVSP